MFRFCFVLFCIFLFGCAPKTEIKYLPSDEKVYRVPAGSTIYKPDGTVEKLGYDGYVVSDGQLIKLYRLAQIGASYEGDK